MQHMIGERPPRWIADIEREDVRSWWARYRVTITAYDEGMGAYWTQHETFLRDSRTDEVYRVDDIGRREVVTSPAGLTPSQFGPEWIKAYLDPGYAPVSFSDPADQQRRALADLDRVISARASIGEADRLLTEALRAALDRRNDSGLSVEKIAAAAGMTRRAVYDRVPQGGRRRA